MLPGLVLLARPLVPVGAVALVLSVRVSSFGDAVVVCAVLFRRFVDAPCCECRMAFPRPPAVAPPPPAPSSVLAGRAQPAPLLAGRVALLS